jgi:hypothetical protein
MAATKRPLRVRIILYLLAFYVVVMFGLIVYRFLVVVGRR